MQKFERQEWQPASKRTRCNNFLGPHIILYWSSLLEVFTLPLLHFMNVCYFFVRFYLILPTYWCYVYVLNCCNYSCCSRSFFASTFWSSSSSSGPRAASTTTSGGFCWQAESDSPTLTVTRSRRGCRLSPGISCVVSISCPHSGTSARRSSSTSDSGRPSTTARFGTFLWCLRVHTS